MDLLKNIMQKIKDLLRRSRAAKALEKEALMRAASNEAIVIKDNRDGRPCVYFNGVELFLIANVTDLMHNTVALGDTPALLCQFRDRYFYMLLRSGKIL